MDIKADPGFGPLQIRCPEIPAIFQHAHPETLGSVTEDFAHRLILTGHEQGPGPWLKDMRLVPGDGFQTAPEFTQVFLENRRHQGCLMGDAAHIIELHTLAAFKDLERGMVFLKIQPGSHGLAANGADELP